MPPTATAPGAAGLGDARRRQHAEDVGTGAAGAAIGRADTRGDAVLAPELVAVRSTLAVQVPPAAMAPFEKTRVVAPAAGAKVAMPQPARSTLGSARHLEAGGQRIGEGDAGQGQGDIGIDAR